MNTMRWTLLGLLAVLAIAAPIPVGADEDFSEFLKPLKPAAPILPPVADCPACQKLGHICSVCKERALAAIAEGKPLPTEPSKVLPSAAADHGRAGTGHPAPGPGDGGNPLVPLARMMQEVEDELKAVADERSLTEHQELIDKIDRQLADAVAKQQELAGKLNKVMDQTQGDQKEIIAYLDDLIAQAEQQQQQQQSSGGSSSSGGQEKPQESSPSGDSNDTKSPTTGAARSSVVAGRAQLPILDDIQHGSSQSLWTELPEKQREAIIADFQEQYPDNWREELERYYKALTEVMRRSAGGGSRNP
jgi:hypothetical protein